MKKSLIIILISILCLLLSVGTSCTNNQKSSAQDTEDTALSNEFEEEMELEMEGDEGLELELEMNEAMMELDVDSLTLVPDTVGLEE